MTSEDLIVNLKEGKIRGIKDVDHYGKKYYSFRGIPYGKPPLGFLRFKAPQPVEKWDGIKDCTKEGDSCYAPSFLSNQMLGTEDCLLLNVYTPELPCNQEEKRAVMVFIHGGGFTTGSGQSSIYGPQFLIHQDIVLVTINYRTGILGFLSMSNPDLEVTGNAGLKDMLLALKWVQSNIKHFNGDPENVTIFGESAGAAGVHALLLNPQAEGLFSKAIMQSSCILNYWTRGIGIAREVAALSGFESVDERAILYHLQTLSKEELYKACEKFKDTYLSGRVRPFGVVIESPNENAFFTKEPEDIIKSGKYIKVPILMGFNSAEGLLSLSRLGPEIKSAEYIVPYIMNIRKGTQKHQETMDKILNFYLNGEKYNSSNSKHVDTYVQIISHVNFVYDVIKSAKLHKMTSDTPIYFYKFTLDIEFNYMKHVFDIHRPGACHADELCYLFKSFVTPNFKPNSTADNCIKKMTKLWTNFAKYGNPTPDKNDEFLKTVWEPMSDNQFNYLEINKDFQMKVDPEKIFYDFWDSLYKENEISFRK